MIPRGALLSDLLTKTTVDKGHGRIETRIFTAAHVVGWIASERSYAEALSRQSGQPVDPARLIGPLLEHFMRNDRAFRRGEAKPKADL